MWRANSSRKFSSAEQNLLPNEWSVKNNNSYILLLQLSAWFAFLMYKHLRRCAGKQLYQLYWATKQQTEKGPQDALTLDARYSLSEEKLLRASIDFRELTVFVLADSASAICDTQVRVLDCDSIGQASRHLIGPSLSLLSFAVD